MNKKWIYLVVILVFLAGSAIGQPPSPPRASVDQLFGEYTLAVARFDPLRLDTDSAIETMLRLVPEEPRHELESPEAHAEFDRFKQQWREAGLREVYLAFDLDDLGRNPPVFLAAPGRGLLGQEAQEILQSGFPDLRRTEAAALGDISVLAAPEVIRRLQDTDRAGSDGWADLLGAMPPGVLQVAIRPYEDWERVIEELMPTLPEFLGGGPSTALTGGLLHGWLSLAAPPDLGLRIEIASRSRPEAEGLREALLAGLDALGERPEVKEAIPNWGAVREALTPEVTETGLAVIVEGDVLEELVRDPAALMLGEARTSALQTASLANLKQIGLAVHVYAHDNDDKLPGRLAEMLPYLGSPRMLMDPRARGPEPDDLQSWSAERQEAWLAEHAGYVYIPRGGTLKELKAPAKTIIAYEKTAGNKPTGTVATLFADGHVERRPAQDVVAQVGAGRR